MQHAAGAGSPAISKLGEVAQVGDDVVAGLLLDFGDSLEVDFVANRAQCGELIFGDGQSQVAL